MKLTKQTIGRSLSVVSVIISSLIQPLAIYSPHVQATTTTTSQNESTSYATVPEGSTYKSIFPDYVLGASVAAQIQGTSVFQVDLTAPVTQSQLDSITELIADYNGPVAQDLEGLQYLHHLKKFYNVAGTNESSNVSDLTPLQHLTELEGLYFENNDEIQDLTPLTNLTQLKEISMVGSKVQDVGPLAGLTNLEKINLSMNKVQDLTPLQNLTKLHYLDVNGTFTDVRPIQDLPLFNNSEGYWWLTSSPVLPDAYVGQSVTIEAYGLNSLLPLNEGTATLDQRYGSDISCYNATTHQLTWLTSGTKGEGVIDFREEGADDNRQLIKIVFKQQVLEAPEGSPVTVTYKDSDGKELEKPTTLTGKQFERYHAEAKDIAGYTLTETPDNTTGTFTDQPQTVAFVYQKQAKESQPVTVTYEDVDGQTLEEPITLTGEMEQAYQAEAKDIAGYTLTETPDNATGTFTDQPQTVAFVYQKQAKESQPVTVTYEDVDGQVLEEPILLTGDMDQAYQAEAKDIAGYTLTETPDNATGTFTDQPQTVAFVYQKNNASDTDAPHHDNDSDEKPLSTTPAESQPLEEQQPSPKDTSSQHGDRLAPLGDSSPWVWYATGGLCLLLGGRLFRKR
ncbi:MucBP domain-containing protein [Paenilisteria rocourtiae]|uniref:Leucine rich repeat (LRR) protein n=1 Tax=Listeria rocourtiae TaxID=647910 RepID=A0A4R6ZJT0_9LIST|nr:MucBP domain-containing protein [Listeria rocourtiae]EUJ47817.1 cell wall surface anchor family protein [Listeria rocourtiae FSL F6-920]MBC1435061.1 hypothetical protein [Listeria rocourtiae]TDR52627.1 leucine rich repeat (LRR) protein [Listeria rocourtiae]